MASIERRLYSLERKLASGSAPSSPSGTSSKPSCSAGTTSQPPIKTPSSSPTTWASTGLALPTLPAAVSYLNRCRDEARPPNPHHLATRLAPWTITPSRNWK